MTSRTAFDAELSALRAALADGAPQAMSDLQAAPDPQPAPRAAAHAGPAPHGPELHSLLSLEGLDRIEELWDRLNTELDDLPRNKPLLTALAALGVGYVLGRVTR